MLNRIAAWVKRLLYKSYRYVEIKYSESDNFIEWAEQAKLQQPTYINCVFGEECDLYYIYRVYLSCPEDEILLKLKYGNCNVQRG